MNERPVESGRSLGDRLAVRYAASSWRLAVTTLAALGLFLLPLYLARGVRLVRIGLLGLAALAGAGLGFAHPYPTWLVLTAVLHSGVDLYIPVPLGWALLAVVGARLVYDLLDGRRLDWGTAAFRLALAVLLAACLTSLGAARDLHLAFVQARTIATGILLYLVISMYVDRRERVVATLGVTSGALALGGLVSLWHLVTVPAAAALALLGDNRVSIMGAADANVSALHAVAAVPLVLYFLGHERIRVRLGAAVVLVLLVTLVVVSASRASVLAIGLLLPSFMLYQRRLRPWAIGLILGLAIALLALPPKYWVRFVSIGQLGGIVIDRSLQYRLHAVEVGWRMFLDHPWTGVGLGNFQVETPRAMMREIMAHNSYLEVAASLGVFGIAGYLGWIGSGLAMLGSAWRAWSGPEHAADRRLVAAVAGSIVSYMLVAAMLSVPFYLLLWLLLAIANALRRIAAMTPDHAGPRPQGLP